MDEHERRSGALWSVVSDDCAVLFEREQMPMLRLATLLVGSAEVGEEIVQDAFASVVERWGSLDNPGGYLRTCVVNGSRMCFVGGVSSSGWHRNARRWRLSSRWLCWSCAML